MGPRTAATILVTAHNAIPEPSQRFQINNKTGTCYFNVDEGNGWWTGSSQSRQPAKDGPWIEALCGVSGRPPVLYRIDTAQSRAWDTDPSAPIHRAQILAFRENVSENEKKYTASVLYG